MDTCDDCSGTGTQTVECPACHGSCLAGGAPALPVALSRDSLLAEISRSLRATHPERAEVLLREIERRVPAEEMPAATEDGREWFPGWISRARQKWMRYTNESPGPQTEALKENER